jgi:hypothetical protein
MALYAVHSAAVRSFERDGYAFLGLRRELTCSVASSALMMFGKRLVDSPFATPDPRFQLVVGAFDLLRESRGLAHVRDTVDGRLAAE